MSFPLGVALYTNVFVAQYFGAKQLSKISNVLWNGVILGLLFSPIFIVSFFAAHLPFQWSGHEAALADAETAYLRYMSIGSLGNVLATVFTSFFTGQGRTWIVMVVDSSAAALNVLLDWLLIFGFTLGPMIVPSMGIKGAAIATTIALWLKAMVFFFLVIAPANRKKFQLFKSFRLDFGLIWRMLRFGSSNGIQFLIECLGIAAFTMMVAKLGDVPAAATTVALSINMMVFVPIFGLSTAVSTLVGQQIGDDRPDLASRATWTSLQIGLIYTGVCASAYIAFPDALMMGHEAMSSEFQEIRNLTQVLLVFVAVYCLFDTFQIVMVAAIKGAGDTTFVVIATLICSIVFVLIGYICHSQFESVLMQLYAWWAGLTLWILMLAIAFGVRFLQGKWKTMKVIEHSVVEQSVVDSLVVND